MGRCGGGDCGKSRSSTKASLKFLCLVSFAGFACFARLVVQTSDERMKIVRFEDLDCWKEARILVNMVYQVTQKESFQKDFRLRDQITGAAISVMGNISEGFDSQSNNEFVRFLRYSRRSISEVQSCLYIAVDQKYITEEERENIYNQCSKTRKIVDGFIRYLRGK